MVATGTSDQIASECLIRLLGRRIPRCALYRWAATAGIQLSRLDSYTWGATGGHCVCWTVSRTSWRSGSRIVYLYTYIYKLIMYTYTNPLHYLSYCIHTLYMKHTYIHTLSRCDRTRGSRCSWGTWRCALRLGTARPSSSSVCETNRQWESLALFIWYYYIQM